MELYLQWPSGRERHNGLSNGAIFIDLERPLTHFQSHVIIWRWIFQKRCEKHT